MAISSHPSVDELRQVIEELGGKIACNVCGNKEFSMEQITTMDSAGGYGSHRLQRAHLICEKCGHVIVFELAKLQ